MVSLPFVGRATELEALTNILKQTRSGSGTVIMVEGVAGIGKTVLLRELQRHVLADADLKLTTFAYGQCYEDTGPHNAYQPFVELLEELVKASAKQKALFEFLASVVKETAPDWLQAIPVVGGFLGAGAKTASMATEWFLEGQGAETRSENMARQYTETIVKIAKNQQLLTLIIEDAHWIDAASCELLLRLSQYLTDARLVLIFTYRPTDVNPEHPLVKARAKLLRREAVQIIRLSGLTEPQIADYVNQRFGSLLTENFVQWLAHLCKGQPLFLSQYLNLLEQEKIIYKKDDQFYLDGLVSFNNGDWQVEGKLGEAPIPDDIDALLDHRIQRLLDEEREMLQIGAVQGEYFGSLILAEVSDKKELAILAKLRHIAEQHRIISLRAGQDWLKDKSEVFAFEHFLMHQAFYRKLTPRERILYHQEIAAVLTGISNEYSTPPRKLLLDIAVHYKNGKQYLQAANYYYKAALSSYSDGANIETIQLCQEALRILRLLPEDANERDKLFANSSLLYLLCANYGPNSRATNLSLLTMVNEGISAAERTNSKSAISQITSFKGHLYIKLGRVPEALSLLREAVQIAKASDDRATEFLTLVQLGTQEAKDSLEESMRVRYEAQKVYKEQIKLTELSEQLRSIVHHEYNKLLVYIGLGEFDSGKYSLAATYLEQGVSEMRKAKTIDELLAGLNYVGQLYTTIGLFEEAEFALLEATNLRSNYSSESLHPWIGYNYGVLGKLYFEWQLYEKAGEALREAMRISDATQQADLVNLVRNYYSELLMIPEYTNMNLDEAERILTENLGESQLGGFHRSVALSLSLLGLLKFKQGAVEEALNYSSQAVGYIRKYGDMPALRTEEVYYNHYQILNLLGPRDQALDYLNQAYDVIERKSNQIQIAAHRESFRSRVRLTQSIIDAYTGYDQAD